MNKFQGYFRAVDFLQGLNNLPLDGDYLVDKHHADRYIRRMRYFLNLIGNPDRELKFIHIAGTSGKGTVTNMVHEILFASGKNVGSFTSPFVTALIEEIKVGDEYISPDEFADIVEYLKPFIDAAYTEGPYGSPSYFEIFFSIALVYFQRKKCDWAVLEVGLGGRYDATNVIERPLVTAITNIDYDHTELLGKTLRKIAFDKAGIIKPGSAFFTTEQRPALLKIFSSICDEKRVAFRALPRQSDYREYNTELATALARHVGVSDESISRGINNMRLPCRFEVVGRNPIVVLDGAHNRAKIRSTLANLRRMTFKKLHLIIGIADNKDHVSILEQVIPLADSVSFTRFQSRERKCAHPKELLKKSAGYLKNLARVRMFLDPERAVSQSIQDANRDDLVLVVGSFFLAGEIRKRWFSEELILEKRKIE